VENIPEITGGRIPEFPDRNDEPFTNVE